MKVTDELFDASIKSNNKELPADDDVKIIKWQKYFHDNIFRDFNRLKLSLRLIRKINLEKLDDCSINHYVYAHA